MDLNQRIIIPSDTLFQEIGVETVLLNLKNEDYFGLDEVGTRMWQLFQEDKSLQQIVDLLREEYDVESDKLKRDIVNFVHALNNEGLITLSTDG